MVLYINRKKDRKKKIILKNLHLWYTYRRVLVRVSRDGNLWERSSERRGAFERTSNTVLSIAACTLPASVWHGSDGGRQNESAVSFAAVAAVPDVAVPRFLLGAQAFFVCSLGSRASLALRLFTPFILDL